jgi:hypothetical protein
MSFTAERPSFLSPAVLQIGVWQHGAYMILQSMARVESAPRIVFTFANVVFKGMVSWPPCHIVNSTSYAIWERVNTNISLTLFSLSQVGCDLSKFNVFNFGKFCTVYLVYLVIMVPL